MPADSVVVKAVSAAKSEPAAAGRSGPDATNRRRLGRACIAHDRGPRAGMRQQQRAEAQAALVQAARTGNLPSCAFVACLVHLHSVESMDEGLVLFYSVLYEYTAP